MSRGPSLRSARRAIVCVLSGVSVLSLALSIGAAGGGAAGGAAWSPDVLQSARALPPHIAGTFLSPLAYQLLDDGSAYVFDRRGHSVYRIDAERTEARPFVLIGQEPGRILQPSAFDSVPSGTFVVADAPYRKERVQIFLRDGSRVGGFELSGSSIPRITMDDLVLNGVGSICFTGQTILINRPESGGLITEYDLDGRARRTIGRLRATGQEEDAALHLAFNSGIPLAIPQGGFYFVFQSGVPLFQRYSESGALQFERRIQGRELDALLAQQPTRWPRRTIDSQEVPIVSPIVRTADVDPAGRLWVSVVARSGATYVYDTDGDKLRTLQFRGAGPLAPTSLFFASATRLLVTPGLFEFDIEIDGGARR